MVTEIHYFTCCKGSTVEASKEETRLKITQMNIKQHYIYLRQHGQSIEEVNRGMILAVLVDLFDMEYLAT